MKSVLFKQNLAFAALSLFVGLGAGAVCGVFGAVLDKIVPYARANFSVNVWFMPLAGLFTAAIFRLFGDGRQGMGAIFAAANGKGRGVGLRTVAFQFAGTWSAHLLCASVGREGAAVQIGAAIGGSVGKSVPVAGADRVLLVAGMAAGFSALFMTPLAAFFFALEVTFCGKLRPQLHRGLRRLRPFVPDPVPFCENSCLLAERPYHGAGFLRRPRLGAFLYRTPGLAVRGSFLRSGGGPGRGRGETAVLFWKYRSLPHDGQPGVPGPLYGGKETLAGGSLRQPGGRAGDGGAGASIRGI